MTMLKDCCPRMPSTTQILSFCSSSGGLILTVFSKETQYPSTSKYDNVQKNKKKYFFLCFFFQEQRIFFWKSTSRLLSSHWPDMGYVPILYKSLPRRMKLPLESGAGMRSASLEVHGCVGKCYAKMKVLLELGTRCTFAGTSHAQFCCCSTTQSCPTLCDPMDCSMPGFPVLLYLPEFAQTHVH